MTYDKYKIHILKALTKKMFRYVKREKVEIPNKDKVCN